MKHPTLHTFHTLRPVLPTGVSPLCSLWEPKLAPCKNNRGRRFVMLLLVVGALMLASCSEQVSNARQEATTPEIYPDYVDVTIPVGFAPLNFGMKSDEAKLVDAVITDAKGHTLHGQGRETTDFDIDDWHKLVSQNVGDSLCVTVSAKLADGWHTYRPFHLYVSTDSIDYGLCYRLIEPGYEVWSKMGIYQRDLSTFEQRPVLENTQFQGCVNCHGFNRGDPSRMSLHIRGPHGATLFLDEGKLTAYNTKTDSTLGFCVYPYWHPSGKYIAYSTNTTRQVFHIRDANRIEVFDAASDIQVYDIEHNQLIITPSLKTDSLYETFPVFSADGKWLYFCAARALPEGSMSLDSLHYNLYRVAFDAERGSYGDAIECVIDAGDSLTVCFPRPSYDGRYLVYSLANYGQFSIWHHEADLWMLDLTTGERRPMTKVNSSDTESFHNWSSNSRWMVFSSRRDDGLFTRPYFTHIDADGHETKPFMLPQQNPRRFYRELFMSFNVPDFIRGAVQMDNVKAVELINADYREPMGVVER